MNLGSGQIPRDKIEMWAANFSHFVIFADELLISQPISRGGVKGISSEDKEQFHPTETALFSKILKIFGLMGKIQPMSSVGRLSHFFRSQSRSVRR